MIKKRYGIGLCGLGLAALLAWALAARVPADPGPPKPLVGAWNGDMILLPDTSACPFSEYDSAQFLFTKAGSLLIDIGGDVVCAFSYRTFANGNQQMIDIRADTITIAYAYAIKSNRLTLESAAHDQYRYTWKPAYRDPAGW
ncbi:MAG TPA: hypothetical protein VD886_23665 [Herpetosiphonaceae bacterium]|nr:hypothetical protein [Herpetosiphonaceae bacterium]